MATYVLRLMITNPFSLKVRAKNQFPIAQKTLLFALWTWQTSIKKNRKGKNAVGLALAETSLVYYISLDVLIYFINK